MTWIPRSEKRLPKESTDQPQVVFEKYLEMGISKFDFVTISLAGIANKRLDVIDTMVKAGAASRSGRIIVLGVLLHPALEDDSDCYSSLEEVSTSLLDERSSFDDGETRIKCRIAQTETLKLALRNACQLSLEDPQRAGSRTCFIRLSVWYNHPNQKLMYITILTGFHGQEKLFMRIRMHERIPRPPNRRPRVVLMDPANPTVIEKNKLFFVLVCFSILSSGAGLLNTILDHSAFGFAAFAQNLGILAFGIRILQQKDFFFEGNLTLKCSSWLVMAFIQLVFLPIVVFFVDYPSGLEYFAAIYGSICGFNALFDIIVFFCYRYWSFFRPYKVVPYIPTYVMHTPVQYSPQAQQQFVQAAPPVQVSVQMNA